MDLLKVPTSLGNEINTAVRNLHVPVEDRLFQPWGGLTA